METALDSTKDQRRHGLFDILPHMTLPASKHSYTIEEYLRLERGARDKHEFHDGEILAMSGGSPANSLISMNIGAALAIRLKGKQCRVYDSNLRIRIATANRYLYADSTVVCGRLETDPDDTEGESATNPRAVIEVLSPSTDRGRENLVHRD